MPSGGEAEAAARLIRRSAVFFRHGEVAARPRNLHFTGLEIEAAACASTSGNKSGCRRVSAGRRAGRELEARSNQTRVTPGRRPFN